MAKEYFPKDILEDAITERQQARKEVRDIRRKKKEAEEEKQRIAAENFKKRRKFLAAAILILLIVAALFGRNFVQIQKLKKEKAQAQARLDELNAQIEKLQDELTRVSSPEYIEQQARNQLRMIYPGETLYIIQDK